jgi:hypothetical protein
VYAGLGFSLSLLAVTQNTQQRIIENTNLLIGVLALGSILAITAFYGIRKVYNRYRDFILLCFAWIIPYMLFITWWEPENIEFWLLILPPIIFIIATGIENLPKTWNKLTYLFLFILIISLSINNFYNGILPRRNLAQNANLQLIWKITDCLSPENMLVLSEGDQWAYIVYYSHVKTAVLTRIILRAESESTNNIAERSLSEFENQIDLAFSQNRKVLALDRTLHSPDILLRNGITDAVLQNFFSKYKITPISCSYPMYQLEQIP